VLAFSKEEAIAQLEESLTRLPAAVSSISVPRLHVPVKTADWSPREILSHMADAEQVYGVRLRMVLTSENPFLPKYEQARWVARFSSSESTHEALDRWMLLRDRNLRIFRTLSVKEWEVPGTHEEAATAGSETPHHIADSLARHDLTHMDQLAVARSMADHDNDATDAQ
jgi:hypothetical protein